MDAKSLEAILRAGGWKSLALTLAAVGTLFADRAGLLDLSDVGRWARPAAWVALFVFGALTLSSTASALAEPESLPRRGLRSWHHRRLREKWAREELLTLDEREKAILAYLVTSGTRHFTADDDGGYAVTLISRRLVHLAGVQGQVFDMRNVPFAVQPEVWKELLRRKDEFLHPSIDSPQPWRIPWMAR
ncbi:MAG: hypothetical protein ABS35_30250 [Kaistia sp. SCN 65-12]|nr:MAG: hypothetical protein ABS35_30250 [Kaistia sp. SCN 65-12]